MRKWLVQKLLEWAADLEWPGDAPLWVEHHYDRGRKYITFYKGEKLDRT